MQKSKHKSKTAITPTLSWQRAFPNDVNDAGCYLFDLHVDSRFIQLQVQVEREGRLWKTEWALVKVLRGGRPALMNSYTVKTRLRPRFDVDCRAAKVWAEDYLLSPMTLLAKGLST